MTEQPVTGLEVMLYQDAMGQPITGLEAMLSQHTMQLRLPIKQPAEAQKERGRGEGRDFSGSIV